ncbi:MAG: cell division protein FtsX [Salinivirgaceae bacterium]
MSKQEQKLSRRKLRSSYFTTIVSIALVLFVVGLMGMLLLNAHKLSRHVKENIGFSVILENNIREVDMIRLQKNLDASRYVKTTEYITKERAAQELQEELGEDFIDFLGYNPLLPSIDVRLFAEYANPDSVVKIEQEILKYEQVKEVAYQKSLIDVVNKNIHRISLVLLVFTGALFIISLSLINNTIRLTVYARRFLIKTMQLVGATRRFVRGPFILKSLAHAIYSIALTYLMLGSTVYMIEAQLPELSMLNDLDILALLFAGVFLVGIGIVYISTRFAVNRYLKLRSSDLYF